MSHVQYSIMDRIYISALDNPAHEPVNTTVIDLLESYAFDVFVPHKKGLSPNGDFSVLSQPLDFSKMMLVMFHSDEVSPQMEHEIEQAIHRRIPMLALSSVPVSKIPAQYVEQFIKVIPIPEDHDELLHPLMTTINRHFPV